MDSLSRDTKAAVEPTTSTTVSPIAAAVANVGYASPNEHSSIADTTTTTTTGGTGTPTASVHAPVEEVEDDEESGGSSAEEEEEEMRQARTAPSTPAPEGGLTSPLDEAGAPTEVLPTYAGNGVSVSPESLWFFRGASGSSCLFFVVADCRKGGFE